jgi:hypothetical protein
MVDHVKNQTKIRSRTLFVRQNRKQIFILRKSKRYPARKWKHSTVASISVAKFASEDGRITLNVHFKRSPQHLAGHKKEQVICVGSCVLFDGVFAHKIDIARNFQVMLFPPLK